MLNLSAKIRSSKGRKVKNLRKKAILPAVLYGPGIDNLNLEVKEKEFEAARKKAGGSSLISLNVEDQKKKFLVLIHNIQTSPLKGSILHIDFYQPKLEEEVEATVPLVFEGECPAVKNLQGTLVKEISEVQVKAKPQHLPRQIEVDISLLETFEDSIKISDLKTPEGVKILKEAEEIVALVSPPENVEEELEKPVEEKVKEVEGVEKAGRKEGKEEEKEEEEKKRKK